MTADRLITADLKVRPAELALDALVTVLGPVAPSMELGDALERGIFEIRR